MLARAENPVKPRSNNLAPRARPAHNPAIFVATRPGEVPLVATRIALALLFAVLLTSSAWAAEGPADQAFRRGLDAFERGTFAAAIAGWSEAGRAHAPGGTPRR